jgi:EAL domain-containing protein (putative c-di-GMP-specific phosphodiesterase class I)
VTALPELAGLQETGSDAASDARRRVDEILAGSGLGMVFQPVVDLGTGATVGHEALARFDDGRPPNVWFAEADREGLGVELELLAIETALRVIPEDVPGYLGVNASPATLASPRLRAMLQHTDGRRRLLLELTERHAVAEYALTGQGMAQMRSAGVLVAIDDLGGDTTTLRQLADLNPDVVKIDRSLVSHIDEAPTRHALAAAFAHLALGMGWTVMAVGIERHEELSTCHALGIKYGQGYLLGRPAPVAETQSSDSSWIALSEEIWQANQG